MKINNTLIRTFDPCYDPSEIVKDENETFTPLKGIEKYRGQLPYEDIVWILCRNEVLSDKQLRLFVVWCAREALKLIDNPDPRSVKACDVAEKYANGEATIDELTAARAAAYAAAHAAARAAYAAADAAAYAAALAAYAAADAAAYAARAATAAKQVDKLIEMLKEE